MRTTEIYDLRCHACGAHLELKAGGPAGTNEHQCPTCGATLVIEFRVAAPPSKEKPCDRKNYHANSLS